MGMSEKARAFYQKEFDEMRVTTIIGVMSGFDADFDNAIQAMPIPEEEREYYRKLVEERMKQEST